MQLSCQQCGAQSELPPNRRSARCPYCGSQQIVTGPTDPDAPSPTFLIPFKVQRAEALALARAWKRSLRHLFRIHAFRAAPIEEIEGALLPAYLYTATALAGYQARCGFSYEVRDDKGNSRTEWEWHSVSGRWEADLTKVFVSASKGVPNHALDKIEPFEMSGLRPWSAEGATGWVIEAPTLSPEAAFPAADQEARATVERRLHGFLPGERTKIEALELELRQPDLEAVQLPLWILPVPIQGRAEPVRILVNGQTGKVGGDPPLSWVKITVTALFSLAAIGVAIAAFTGAFS